MAKVETTFVARDMASKALASYTQAAKAASASTDEAKAAVRNYESALNSVQRKLITARPAFENLVQQEEAMVASGQQQSAEFKTLDARTEKLGASIRDLEALERSLTGSLSQASAALKTAEEAKSAAETKAKQLADAEKQAADAEKRAQAATGALAGEIKKLVASYVGLQGLKKAVSLSDELATTRARLNSMNDGLQTTAELENMVFQSAQRARASYADTMDIVTQLGMRAPEAFSSSKEIVQFAELLNKQLKLSGASASEANAAISQLDMSLASGTVRTTQMVSLMKQAPTIAQAVADYIGVGVDELRDMAKNGQITGDILKNALYDAAEETNAEFEKLPMTWAQVWTVASNAAIRALDPLLSGINWLANNVETVVPIVLTLGSAFGILLIAANWTNILAAATKTAASMQAFYNAVMAANPIALTAAAVLILVAALYAGVAAFNQLSGSSISATGTITSAFATLAAFVFNGVLVPLQNGFAAFVNFLANAFNDPIDAINIALYDLSITCLKYLQNVAQGLEGLINMIPGVEVDFTSGIDQWIGKLQYGRNWTIQQTGYKEVVKPWQNIDLGKAYTAGYDWGANLSIPGLSGKDASGMLEIPQAADITSLLGNIDKNTGKIQKTVDLSDETLKMMVDVAERKFVNNINLTSQAPVITVQGQNTGDTEQDRKDLAEMLGDLIFERVQSGSVVPVR